MSAAQADDTKQEQDKDCEGNRAVRVRLSGGSATSSKPKKSRAYPTESGLRTYRVSRECDGWLQEKGTQVVIV